MGSCRLESLMLILRSSYLEANLPELLAKFGFLFLLPPWPIPSADLPAGGSGEDTHEKFHPFFPLLFNFELVASCTVSDPAVGSRNPGFCIRHPFAGPRWSRSKVILPSHLAATLILHHPIHTSQCISLLLKFRKDSRKYTKGGIKVIDSN